MYDPMTVIYTFQMFGYSILTLWHIDPEADGTDDSCGWFNPKILERDVAIIDEMTDWDMDMPYLSSPYLPLTTVDPKYDYSQILAGDCLSFIAWAWMHMAWARDRRSSLTTDEWWQVVSLSSSPHDNLRFVLADPDEDARYKVERFLYCVLKAYLRHHRPRWRHPRWHIHHWRVQIHPLQALRRWLFSRCAHCERRFSWGYSPIAANNHDQKTPWLGGEQGVFHHRCYSEMAAKSEEEEKNG